MFSIKDIKESAASIPIFDKIVLKLDVHIFLLIKDSHEGQNI